MSAGKARRPVGRPREDHLPRRTREDIALCKRVESIALAQGLTRKDLGVAWGVSEGTAANWLLGKIRMRPQQRSVITLWLERYT